MNREFIEMVYKCKHCGKLFEVSGHACQAPTPATSNPKPGVSKP